MALSDKHDANQSETFSQTFKPKFRNSAPEWSMFCMFSPFVLPLYLQCRPLLGLWTSIWTADNRWGFIHKINLKVSILNESGWDCYSANSNLVVCFFQGLDNCKVSKYLSCQISGMMFDPYVVACHCCNFRHYRYVVTVSAQKLNIFTAF